MLNVLRYDLLRREKGITAVFTKNTHWNIPAVIWS